MKSIRSEVLHMSVPFIVVLVVSLLFLTAMFTAAYNDDKTKGL
ncbi:hypothetical protein [Paenibacillus humicus]|nr:hypothetical protein BN871_HA_00190 [Paenibacillus sp. P22]